MTVRELWEVTDGGVDAADDTFVVEIRSWRYGSKVIDYKWNEVSAGPIPDVLLNLTVQNVYAKGTNHFIIDVLLD